MHKKRKQRLILVCFLVLGLGTAAGLLLYALRQNVNLYYTPSQLLGAHVPKGRHIRLGGMVEKGSVRHAADSLQVSFILTDFKDHIVVSYNGLLPSLFREGQGIVAEGQLNMQGDFIASQVLAKHDADYHPPGMPSNASNKATNDNFSRELKIVSVKAGGFK